MRKWQAAVACLCLAAIAVYYFFPSKKATPAGQPGVPERPSALALTSTPTFRAATPAKTTVSTSAVPTAPTTATAGPSNPPASATLSAPPGAVPDQASSGESEGTNIPPNALLENVSLAIRDYRSRLGGNPVGTNPEITEALNAGNPKQVNFLRPGTGMRINGKGELVDSWGTPFFFHQLSGSEMEIHSAGPDRKMWTADDLVTK
jgi:hypothetical protein